MGKINILSEELCNRIAAGEVIDRPYSAVKELVENSIDAGATEIEIRIERGGKDLIEITDNGCGIEEDDLRAAFIPHATSKITAIDDISHIHTLGFRGEALATIAAISCVEMISAVEGKEGHKVECDGDYVCRVSPAATSSSGTKISVRKFFFNTPVRFKFMKSDKKEESDITNYVTRYVLGYPEISFKYYIDGKLCLQSYGGGLEEAITQVYGANVLPNCFKISADRNDLKISGFISNQNFFKSNKTYQKVYLNGRHIENAIISSAIQNAYSAYAMKRQYPFYVLNIQVPDDFVDVNVHPNKADVRFVDTQLIYGTIYKVISGILDGTVKAADFVISDKSGENTNTYESVKPERISYAAEFAQPEKIYDKDFSDVAGIEQFTKAKQPEKPQLPRRDEGFDYTPYENYEQPDFSKIEEQAAPKKLYDRANQKIEDTFSFCSGDHGPMYVGKLREAEARQKAVQEEILYRQCKYKGSLFNTYLMYEIKDDVYIIDQHAAHERLLYDQLKQKISDHPLNKQGLLVPYIFLVNPDEKQFIEKNLVALWQMGFTVEAFGTNSYRVNELPADLPDIDPKSFFEELLSNVDELKEITLVDILKDKIAQTACKHAVKGGEVLTDGERDKLFSMLRGNMGLKCPHGRPVCVKLTKTEIEKMFKRKV